MLVDLKNGSNYLEEFEGVLWRLNIEYKDKYVKRAHDHAMDLMRESIRLERFVISVIQFVRLFS